MQDLTPSEPVAATRIYEPVPAEGFEWALPVNDEDFEVFSQFDGTPRESTWRPIRVELVGADDEAPRPREADFPWLGKHVIVLRERAVLAVGDLLRRHGELLPLVCDAAALWVLNVCRVVDALDEERSDIVRFSSGRIMAVRRPAFRPERLGDATVFKVPQMVRGPIYLNGDAVDSIRSAGLSGLDFRLVDADAADASSRL